MKTECPCQLPTRSDSGPYLDRRLKVSSCPEWLHFLGPATKLVFIMVKMNDGEKMLATTRFSFPVRISSRALIFAKEYANICKNRFTLLIVPITFVHFDRGAFDHLDLRMMCLKKHYLSIVENFSILRIMGRFQLNVWSNSRSSVWIEFLPKQRQKKVS